MKKFNRSFWLMLCASLLLVLVFFFPIWKIVLNAPQYPNGIGFYIWIDHMSGITPNALENINLLNHYVGMEKIIPESFAELNYFPFVIAGLIFLGLIVSWINKPKAILVWIIIIVVLGGLGIYDFYQWEYVYGHNLNPMAPISIPGMSYQPPLIGTKKLLNFTAISLPSIGSFIFAISTILSVLAWYFSKKAHKIVK